MAIDAPAPMEQYVVIDIQKNTRETLRTLCLGLDEETKEYVDEKAKKGDETTFIIKMSDNRYIQIKSFDSTGTWQNDNSFYYDDTSYVYEDYSSLPNWCGDINGAIARGYPGPKTEEQQGRADWVDRTNQMMNGGSIGGGSGCGATFRLKK